MSILDVECRITDIHQEFPFGHEISSWNSNVVYRMVASHPLATFKIEMDIPSLLGHGGVTYNAVMNEMIRQCDIYMAAAFHGLRTDYELEVVNWRLIVTYVGTLP